MIIVGESQIETLVPSKGPSVNEVSVRNVNGPMPTMVNHTYI